MPSLASLAAAASAAAFFSVASANEDAASRLLCHACMASSTELVKRSPILSREGVKKEDKEVAVGEAFDSFCSSWQFAAYIEDRDAASKACKDVVSKLDGEEGLMRAAFVAGRTPSEVCFPVCEGVPEEERLPTYTPPAREAKKAPAAGKGAAGKGKGKGKAAPAGRKGTVDDPQVQEAFRRKAERDARRKAGKGKGRAADDDEDAGEL
jgi:hypothetical protein